ncbi:MAG TPA: metal-dependent transcriptional regulator [Anaerolineales bacterium]|nr:metal-dependent transcriptional regulator [Anaerolineales bacterium]
MEVNRSQQKGLCGLDGEPTSLPHEHHEPDADAITHARREYLAEIFRLHASTNEPVTTTALAARLDVSPPAVVRMMRRLAIEGYLRRKPYKGVVLTPEGVREALKSIRRHRLLEAFLVTVMKFGWDEVHDHAHGLDAVINDQFEDRMDELAGHPTRCPHGDPIPTKDGQLPPTRDVSLAAVPPGAAGIIRRIGNHTPDKLRYLAEHRLVPGTPITLLNRAPFNGPVRLKMPVGEQVLGAEMANDLYIELA